MLRRLWDLGVVRAVGIPERICVVLMLPESALLLTSI